MSQAAVATPSKNTKAAKAAKADAAARTRFAEVRTLHVGTVQWWWVDARVHDSDYTIKVNDAVRAAVAKAVERYDVREDTRFCCQWEGVCIDGEDLQAVTAAINDISLVLSRFKDVIGLAD